MKTFSDLTMAEYIRLACGEFEVLKTNPFDTCSRDKLLKAAKVVTYEYSRIADAAATRVSLNKQVSRSAEMLRTRLFRVCLRLMSLSAFDDVRTILTDYGLRASTMTDTQLVNEVKRLHKRSLANLKRMAASDEDAPPEPTAEQIRARFDQQMASLMTYFKFQIDVNTIKASTVAYMIRQANREIKAQMAAIKR